MTIPISRPVVGSDLDDVRKMMGISASDACWVFGLSMTKWTELVRKQPDQPLTNPSLALLVRSYDRYPHLCPLPKLPDAEEFSAYVNEIMPIDNKHLSIMMGNEASSAYRWLTQESNTSPVFKRLAHVFMELGRSEKFRSKSSRRRLIYEWESMVDAEAKARGRDDIWKRGRWSNHKSGVAAAPAAAKATKAAKTTRIKRRPKTPD